MDAVYQQYELMNYESRYENWKDPKEMANFNIMNQSGRNCNLSL